MVSDQFRDPSFSSYLNHNQKTFAESSNHFISNRKDPLHQGVKKEEDEEIGVFDAEKYFNGVEMETPRVTSISIDANKYQDQQQKTLANRKYKVKYGTPSERSESSLNSQSALLQAAIKNSSRNGKNQVQKKSLLASFGCKCSCYDKNSVDVNDHAGEISFNKASTPKKLFKGDLDSNHSVKITKPPHSEILINKGLVKMQLQEIELPRKSLQVFGSPILDNRSKSLSFDKRSKVPSWDTTTTTTKMEEIELSQNSIGNYDDVESDASSDLFEIESLTGKFTSNVASGCASPTHYAPSEASIEWSVVTASAVEYTAMSDYDDQGSVATIRSPLRTSLTTSNGKPKVTKDMQRRRPGKLLGCNSQKAVGVASDSFIKPSSNQQFRRKSDIFPQAPRATRFQTETKDGNFGVRHEQQQHGFSANPPPLRRSHSPHASQLLYI